MSTDLSDRTVFPPEDGVLRQLEEFIDSVPVAELRSPEGRSTPLPDEVYEVLRDVVEAMSRGQAITVAPHDQTLTTQAAADLLGISRPTLVKLLERGEIPYTQPGRHRRLRLMDVLAYRQHAHDAAERALDELVEISEEADLYREEVTTTRLRR
ncbi:helix-turn-helix domain-containing protein [Nitriliruptoraceae bacterium ZYF776]|nr:helix-turn-helix domain-containing protein [Profundirhabdus halotolerans]